MGEPIDIDDAIPWWNERRDKKRAEGEDAEAIWSDGYAQALCNVSQGSIATDDRKRADRMTRALAGVLDHVFDQYVHEEILWAVVPEFRDAAIEARRWVEENPEDPT